MAHNPALASRQTTYFRLYLQSFLAPSLTIVFTNVSSPDHWNFDQNCLPDVLRARYENQWLLDNPLSLWKKIQEMQSQPQTRATKRFRDNPMEMLRRRHQAALKEICSLFDWLDDRDPQPTKLKAARNNKVHH
jgi:hypothetical protein